MNPPPDEPFDHDVPLTRADFGTERDPLNDRTAIDRTNSEAPDGPEQTLEVTDPAMTRAPSPDLTAASLADWIHSNGTPRSDPATGGITGRGIIGTIEPGQTLYGKYQVLRKLGGGAMGDVWLVRHATLKIEHALKVIVPNFARNAVALMRFQREFEVMATLRHEHAVTIYDACIDDDGGYIDMEFVDGPTLDAILAEARSRPDRDLAEPLMPLNWIVRILDQLCDVLQTAHEKGIVHRDLKPSNMMLKDGRQPGKEYLKVLDFGIAKIRDDPESASGYEQEESSSKTEGFIGTPSYGSPEQALAMDDVDGRADLYSVGIMLYEFVAGRLPFRGSPLQVMTQNANSPPPLFHESNPKLRSMPEVEHAIFRILSKDRTHRPQTARELFDEFREAVESVVSAGQPRRNVPSWNAEPIYSPIDSPRTTELENPSGANALLSTMEATLVAPGPRTESIKQTAVESASDLGLVMKDRPKPPWRIIAALGVVIVGFLVMGALIVANRSKPSVVAEKSDPSIKKLRFEDYWPENYVAVDASAQDQIWPDKVRQTIDDRYFNRFNDGIYLPDGFTPEDPKKLVDGWPAAIVRDGIRFLRIEGNKEWPMGAWDAEVEPGRSDVPAHAVKLSGYYLQETEVTNGQYEDFLEKNAITRPTEWERIYADLSRKVGREIARSHPAVNLSRKQAIAFARSIDSQLPTEAEWEFAARSRGENRRYVWGDSPGPTRVKANIDSDSDKTTAPVKSYPEDRTVQGLCDMLGNVQEFCRDLWEPYKKNLQAEVDPYVQAAGNGKSEYVIRGACFNSTTDMCAVTRRDEHYPEAEISEKFGFRVVVECPAPRKPR